MDDGKRRVRGGRMLRISAALSRIWAMQIPPHNVHSDSEEGRELRDRHSRRADSLQRVPSTPHSTRTHASTRTHTPMRVRSPIRAHPRPPRSYRTLGSCESTHSEGRARVLTQKKVRRCRNDTVTATGGASIISELNYYTAEPFIQSEARRYSNRKYTLDYKGVGSVPLGTQVGS